MEFSAAQERAIETVRRWYRAGDAPYFYLAGYAGTGKTTLARHFAEGVEGEVLFAAYTGKAASVLTKKGVPATTIHRILYKPIGKSIEELTRLKERLGTETLDPRERARIEEQVRTIRRELDEARFRLWDDGPMRDAALVVLDECSMIDREMMDHLLSFRKPVLVLGDPGQLPPVKGAGALSREKPDVILQEVHRQAMDSPILRFATMARKGQPLPRDYSEPGALIAPRKLLSWGDLLAADQVIVGFNETRRRLNLGMRRKAGRSGVLPAEGDKLICLRNDHVQGFLNGVTATATSDAREAEGVLRHELDLDYDGEPRPAVQCYSGHFQEYDDPNVEHLSRFERRGVQEFDFGYAVTCHKAQGSEWPHVIVLDEGFGRDDLTRRRWLYTALTRAQDKLTVLT